MYGYSGVEVPFRLQNTHDIMLLGNGFMSFGLVNADVACASGKKWGLFDLFCMRIAGYEEAAMLFS